MIGPSRLRWPTSLPGRGMEPLHQNPLNITTPAGQTRALDSMQSGQQEANFLRWKGAGGKRQVGPRVEWQIPDFIGNLLVM